MGAINPQSCSSSNRASMGGASNGKEGEVEMSDPQSCPSSNRASMDGTGDGREEEARRQIHNLALTAIEQILL